jgi:hypothetical protein
MVKKPKTYSVLSKLCGTWFVISIVIVFAYLCVGVMTGSAEQFPNWDIFAIL